MCFSQRFSTLPYIGEEDFSAIIANIKDQSVEGMEATFNKVTTHLKSHGFEKFLCIGFCWGVWFAFRMAAKYDCFKAIVGPHPSIGL
jgi:dienelactone hydrolase